MRKALNPYIVLLTGPKHVGKTSTGRRLAHLCKDDFIDLDEAIEKQTGKSPRSLYQEAPDRFRQAEAMVLENLMGTFTDTMDRGSRHIIAAGGGIIDNDTALSLLKKPEVLIIYLEVSPETAWARIYAESRKGGSLPPFLDTLDPQKTHKHLHQRRSTAYRRIAHLIIQADHKDPEHISMEIIRYLSKFRENRLHKKIVSTP